MKKKNKIKIIGSGILFTSSVIATISVIAQGSGISVVSQEGNLSNANTGGNANNFKYLFNNQYYDSLDDITNELVNNNKYINDDLYYGNAKNAIFDHQTNQININQLKKFDQNRVSAAYLNAFGGYEQDFNKAKKSFVNEGLVKYKYQDTNGVLHSSYAEAQREILKGIKIDETVFYEVHDEKENKTVKINPLNQEDINKMKAITLSNATHSASNPSTANTFGVMPMFNTAKSNSETDNFVSLSSDSWLNNLYTQTPNNFIAEIIGDFQKAITGVFENSHFTATVKFNYSDANKMEYYLKAITNIAGTDLPKIIYNPRNNQQVTEIEFYNVPYKLLNHFDVFLNRNTWEEKNHKPNEYGVGRSTQLHNGLSHRADKLTFTNFLERKGKFELLYQGEDGYGISGINTKILTPGTYNNHQLDFDVNFQLEETSKDDNTFEKTPIQNKRGFLELVKSKISWLMDTKENNAIEDPLKKMEQNFKNNLFLLFADILFKDEQLLENYFYVTYKYNNGSDSNNINYLKTILDNLNKVIENIVNKTLIDTYFLGFYKNMNYFLTYKKSPIFKIDDKFSIKYFIEGEYFYQTYLNEFNEGPNDLLKSLSNISNNISKDGNSISSNNSFVKIDLKDDGLFSIKTNEYQGSLFPEDNSSSGDDPKPTYNNFDYALNSYNKNLKELKAKYSNQLPETIKNKLILNTNDILVLTESATNVGIKMSNLYYGEFLSLVYDFNESLSKTNGNKKIFYNQPELELVKSTSNKINPAKVIIIYDLLGNVINPGIQLSDDLAMETTSDAMYDSERTILDNIYRTLIVKNDPNKIYYKNDNQTYTLLDYETNFVYKLSYNNKTHYFLTYKDAWLYLRDIIRLEAQRVSI